MDGVHGYNEDFRAEGFAGVEGRVRAMKMCESLFRGRFRKEGSDIGACETAVLLAC